MESLFGMWAIKILGCEDISRDPKNIRCFSMKTMTEKELMMNF
jgi:hypothetical protein